MARLMLLAPLLMAFIGLVTAVTDAYVQITPGAQNPTISFTEFSQFQPLQKFIPVSNYSFEVENTLVLGSQSTGAGAGKATFDVFSFTRNVDSNSPVFFLALAEGVTLSSVVLSLFPAGGTTVSSTPRVIYTFNTVVLSSQSVSEDSNGNPVEKITLQYGKLTVSSAPQNADGTLGKPIVSAWNRVSNSPTKKIRGVAFES